MFTLIEWMYTVGCHIIISHVCMFPHDIDFYKFCNCLKRKKKKVNFTKSYLDIVQILPLGIVLNTV